MKIFLYILQSEKDQSYYIGISKNPTQRLKEHNLGYTKSTKHRKPFKLLYTASFESYKAARRVEKVLKSYDRNKLVKFMTQ